MDGKKRFCPLLGLRPKGGAARHPCSIVLNMVAPHTCVQVCFHRLAAAAKTGGQTRRRLREGWLRRIPTGKIIGRLTKPRRDIPIGISR